MLQLIAHLMGDYCLQNDWMAANKAKAWWPTLVHASIYTSVFVLFCLLEGEWSSLALFVIWSTHLVIDRFNLAQYWVKFYRVGQQAPPHIKDWLRIIVDNTMHLAINYYSLRYL